MKCVCVCVKNTHQLKDATLAASRSTCTQTQRALTALLPSANDYKRVVTRDHVAQQRGGRSHQANPPLPSFPPIDSQPKGYKTPKAF